MVVVPLTVVFISLLAGFSPGGSGIMALASLVPLSLVLIPATRQAPWQLA